MDAGYQISLHDQLLQSTAVVLATVENWDPIEFFDLGSFREGLRSAQDTLMGFRSMSTSTFDPFYLLCLYPCKALSDQISPDGNVSCLRNISVTGYDLCQFQEVHEIISCT